MLSVSLALERGEKNKRGEKIIREDGPIYRGGGNHS